MLRASQGDEAMQSKATAALARLIESVTIYPPRRTPKSSI
jgi:hypothetical protein